MNGKQRITIFAGIAFVFIMLLIPPYYSAGRFAATNFAGYGFIFAPDSRYKLRFDDGIYFAQDFSTPSGIDFVRLLIQVLLVAVLVGGLAFAFHSTHKEKAP